MSKEIKKENKDKKKSKVENENIHDANEEDSIEDEDVDMHDIDDEEDDDDDDDNNDECDDGDEEVENEYDDDKKIYNDDIVEKDDEEEECKEIAEDDDISTVVAVKRGKKRAISTKIPLHIKLMTEFAQSQTQEDDANIYAIPETYIDVNQYMLNTENIKNAVDVFRNNCSKTIHALLYEHDRNVDENTENKNTLYTHVKNIEIALFNYCVKEAKNKNIACNWLQSNFILIYLNRFNSYYCNFKNNAEFAKKMRIIPDTIETYEKMENATHFDMNSEKWQNALDKNAAMEANRYDVKLEPSTDEFTCRACRSQRCSHYQLQTRSADEPMTIFVTCLDCGKKWREK